MTAINLCNFPLLRVRDVPCGCAPPPLQCEVENTEDLPACDMGGTAYFPSPPYPANTPIQNGDVFVVTDPAGDGSQPPTPFFFWECVWYPFLSETIDGDSDWFKEGTAGPFYGGINTDPAYHQGTIGVRRTTIRGNMAIDIGDSSGTADGGILAEGLYIDPEVSPQPALPITGAGTRLMWIPTKAAFRAGGVDVAQWDAMGDFSAAFGINNIASGVNSFSIGLSNESAGDWTFTAGQMNYANVDSSFAIGSNNIADDEVSFVGGAYNRCSARRGWVTGRNCIAQPRAGEPEIRRCWIHGWNSEVNGETSFVVGEWLKASGDHTVLFGYENGAPQAHYTQTESFIVHGLRPFIHVPASAPTDIEIANSQFSVWVNEGTNELTFRVRYSGGTLKTGTVALV